MRFINYDQISWEIFAELHNCLLIFISKLIHLLITTITPPGFRNIIRHSMANGFRVPWVKFCGVGYLKFLPYLSQSSLHRECGFRKYPANLDTSSDSETSQGYIQMFSKARYASYIRAHKSRGNSLDWDFSLNQPNYEARPSQWSLPKIHVTWQVLWASGDDFVRCFACSHQ